MNPEHGLRSEKRAKEVGIHQISGLHASTTHQPVLQWKHCGGFTVIHCITGFGFYLALPAFNQVADKQLTLLLTSPTFWFIGIGFGLFTGLIAGSYPTLYLSSFQPVKVLKGTFRAGQQASIQDKY